MNKEKRLAYCTNNTQVGFHTGNGTTDNMIGFKVADNINIINSCNVRKVRNRDWYKTYIHVNPNKNNGGYILENGTYAIAHSIIIYHCIFASLNCYTNLFNKSSV